MADKKVKKINAPIDIPDIPRFEKKKRGYYNSKVFLQFLVVAFYVLVLVLPVFKLGESSEGTPLILYVIGLVKELIPTLQDLAPTAYINIAIKYGVIIIATVLSALKLVFALIRFVVYFFKGFSKKNALLHVNREFYGNKVQKRRSRKLRRVSYRGVGLFTLYIMLLSLKPVLLSVESLIPDGVINQIYTAIFYFDCSGITLMYGGIALGLGIFTGLISNGIKKSHNQYKVQYA